MFLIVFLFIIKGVAESFQAIKVWNVDTNFDNARNWPGGRLPCSKDRVIFPEDAHVVVYVPNSASFEELVLPIRGELVFEEGANLLGRGFYSEKGCIGQDVNFVVSTDSWFDPSKWNTTSSHLHPADESLRKNHAVPHAFRIPCQTDLVTFLPGKSFTVNMEESTVSIGGLVINQIKYSNELFQAVLARTEGYLLFQGSPRITVSGHGCEDVSGCICGNEGKKVLTKICLNVDCPSLECSDPVRPIGSCCPICGSFLTMEIEADFEIKRLVDVLESRFSKQQEVHWSTAKTANNIIQTIFVDAGPYKGDANELAKSLYYELKQDIGASNSNRLKSVYIQSSENWLSGIPTHSPYTGKGLSSGGTAAVIIIIICIGCAAVAWYIYRKRRIPGFSFARFDLHSSKIELELGTTPHEILSPDEGRCPSARDRSDTDSTTVSKAFDNPVYGTAQATEERQEKKIPDIISADENIVENPMFMVFDSTMKEEQSLTQ